MMVQSVAAQNYYNNNSGQEDPPVILIVVIFAVIIGGGCIFNICYGACLLSDLVEKDNRLPSEKRYMTPERRKEFWKAHYCGGEFGGQYHNQKAKEEIDRQTPS